MNDKVNVLPFAADFAPANEEQWRALVDKVLKGAPFDRLVSKTADGIEILPLTARRPNGPRPVRAQTGRWDALSRIDHLDGPSANEQGQVDLAGGASGLHLVFEGSAGDYGFGLPHAALEQVLEGIDPAGCCLLLDPGKKDNLVANAIADLIDASGLNPASASVSFGLDPVGTLLLAETTGDFSETLAQAVSTTQNLMTRGFAGPFLAADARPVHAAGSGEAQELAYLLASAVCYMRGLEGAGTNLAEARAAIEFRICADADQFLTIAKLRALRRLIARVDEACGLEGRPIRVHAETAWRMMTRNDPWVNVLRATVGVFSAVTGGADSVSVLPYTQALGLPDAQARRLARNIQLVLNEETHLGQVDDAAAGASGIEKLTDDLCIKAWTLFQDIERMGGIASGILSGALADDIATVRKKRQDEIARGRIPLTGTSSFPNLNEEPAPILSASDESWHTRYKHGWRPSRLSDPFEALRRRAIKKAAAGQSVNVFMANMGTVAEHTARSNFAINFLGAGGLSAIGGGGLDSPKQAAESFSASGARIACLCSNDEQYRTQGAAFAQALKDGGARSVLIALRPGENAEAWKAAGVDIFLYQGCNMIETLEAILDCA